jgi:hypothetical protein
MPARCIASRLIELPRPALPLPEISGNSAVRALRSIRFSGQYGGRFTHMLVDAPGHVPPGHRVLAAQPAGMRMPLGQ